MTGTSSDQLLPHEHLQGSTRKAPLPSDEVSKTDRKQPAMNDTPKYVPVFQGETRISDNADEVMTTILGSCIATCMWDPVARVGGINHFLLPGDIHDRGDNLSYGVNAMELLINGLLRQGAERSNLKVKLFGGAKMFSGGAEIGVKNAKFAEWYMLNEGFEVIGRCLGGHRGRKIRFWPASGRVQRCFIADDAEIAPPVTTPKPTPTTGREQGEVQLF